MAYADTLEVNSETRKIHDTDGRAMICISIEENVTATATHSKGAYFIYDDKLYKATVAIAIGDTITEGTNCEEASITEVLKNIEDATVIDTAMSSSSTNAVQNKVIFAALNNKQNTLTFDSSPTANSNNPVKSSGIKAAIDVVDNNVKQGDEATMNYHLGLYIGEDGGLCQTDA